MPTPPLAIILTVSAFLTLAPPAAAKIPDIVGLVDPESGEWHLRNEAVR